MNQLLDIMARLRDPEMGCPWDRKQTFKTIVPYTIEEAYEVAEAIGRGDMAELRDELGDLLFQVVFYAQMAKEEGHFDFDAVAHGISEKMVRRHPHVFADADIGSADEQREAWERHKRRERADKDQQGTLDGIAKALPALIRAEKLQRRAAKVGFDWPDIQGPIAKVREELAEVEAHLGPNSDRDALEAEIGDLLFSCVNLARHAGIDAEAALRVANSKFECRFSDVERALMAEGKDIHQASLEDMDLHWEAAKKRSD